MKNWFIFILLLFPFIGFSQNTGKILGTVKDKNTQEELVGVTVGLKNASNTLYQMTDADGKFTFTAPVGTYTLVITSVGYEDYTLYNLNLTSGNPLILNCELNESRILLNEVVIKNDKSKSARAADMITPLSTQRLTTEEIKSNPGGNFDVSRVIQVLPGVAGGFSSNRNDIIVRGGAPNENVYYLDGIEIPVLNHFQTQGANGGATGILNVSFIEDVQLSSSAFDAQYDNALASTFVIKQRNANPEKLSGNLRLSGTEFATTLEGPLSEKTTFIASARKSYLQYLFKLIDLPIRPNYWDFQFKVNHQINKKTSLNIIGLGAIDNFKLEVPKEASLEDEYIMRSNPTIDQWNYTLGVSLKRLIQNGYWNLALSRNMFWNGADRFEDNVQTEANRSLKLRSFEAENKLRWTVNQFNNGWKWAYGASAQWVGYDMDLFNKISNGDGVSIPSITLNFQNDIQFLKYGAFVQSSKYFFNQRLLLSGGLRTDMNSYTNTGNNPLKTLSPRLSFSYGINSAWDLNGSVGRYYKIPTYTALGYKTNQGVLVNKDLEYIGSNHYTLGIQYLPKNDLRFTWEAFYKTYDNYPVSVSNGISLANQGAEYSAVGNESLSSIGKGKVYGTEMFLQQKLVKRLFYAVSTTLYKSLYTGTDGKYIRSSWDYGFIGSAALGYKAKNNWDFGLKYRIAGGQPYTPFDMEASQRNYLITGIGTLDYSRLNSERLDLYNQLDVRVDKRINFKKTSLNLFLDFQNFLRYKVPSVPKYTFERTPDNSGFATTDGLPLDATNSNAIPTVLFSKSATVVPSIGFIWEF